MRKQLGMIAFLLLIGSACGDSGEIAGVGSLSITRVGGNGQAGTGGTELGSPFAVEVTDVDGRAVEDVAVEWTITSGGGGSLSATETTTDEQGRTSVTATLPNLEGSFLNVRASPVKVSSSTSFTATVARTLSGAESLQKVSGDGQLGAPRQELSTPYVVKVVDDAGAGVPEVDVRFFVQAGGGSLSSGTVTSGDEGRASVTATLPEDENATQRVGATVASLTDTVSFESTTTAFPTVEIVSGDGQKGIAGDTLLDRVRVEVTDGQGTLLEGVEVEWQVGQGGGTLLRGTTTANADGLAENRWRLGRTVGEPQTAIATVDPANTSADQVTFTATATGPPDRIEVEQGAVEEDNNATMAPEGVVGDTVTVAPDHWSRRPFKVTVVDASGESVRGAEVTWMVTSGGGTVGDQPEGGGAETVFLTTGRDGSIAVWRRAAASPTPACEDDSGNYIPSCWIGATLSVENFSGVDPVTLDALVRE